jgi:hypothetical protein
VGSVLFLLLAAAAGSDVINERFTVSGLAIEAHWQIDCREVLTQYRQLTGAAPSGLDADVLQTLSGDAQKCGIIYNTPNTGRTVECPDYRQIKAHLDNLTSNSTAARSAQPIVTDCTDPVN